MTDDLHRLQFEFSLAVCELIKKADAMGYQVSLGEAWRSPEECARLGHDRSCHGIRLAIDLNLFYNGEYLTSSKAHQALGDWWCDQGDHYSHGGVYGDGNHYSFEWRGRR